MLTEVQQAKRRLREAVRLAVEALSVGERAAAAARIRGRLRSSRAWQSAGSVLFFASLPDEPDLWPLLQETLDAGKSVGLPWFDGALKAYRVAAIRDLKTDVAPGYFGIPEPVEACRRSALKRLDLILVPGIGFDLHGRRLGRGKGFYDRLLSAVRGTACGVAFDQQLVEVIPTEPHDYHLNCIVTPSRWVELPRTELE